MSKLLRVLFVGESSTLAHVARPYALACSLDSKSYEVHFASDNYFKNLTIQSNPQLSTDITHWQIKSRSPQDFAEILRRGEVLFPQNILEDYVEEEIPLLENINPEVVVGDMRLSLAVSATLLGIPYIALTNATWSPYAKRKTLPLPSLAGLRKWGLSDFKLVEKVAQCFFNLGKSQIFRAQAAGLNAVRRKYGLSAFPNYLSGFTHGDLTLYCDTPSLFPTQNLPSNHQFIGPVTWEPKTSLPNWWSKLDSSMKTIYVCLGSSGDYKLLPEIIEALSEYQVIVAGDYSNPPAKVFAEPYLPGSLAAKRAEVVVTNGGSPSTYQALAQGKPVIGIASNMDQLINMTHVEAAGLGVLIRADNFKKSALTHAIKAFSGQRLSHTSAELHALAEKNLFEAVLQKYRKPERLRRNSL